jgi:subtilisin-like proprotein convertase family protein
MRSEPSVVKGRGDRERTLAGASRRSIRKSQLRKFSLEVLEQRELLASNLPSPVAPLTATNVATGSNGLLGGNASAPSIAIDRYQPNKMVAVWTEDNPGNPNPFTKVYVSAAYSNDAGRTWHAMPGMSDADGSAYSSDLLDDPTTQDPIQTFAQVSNASVAFDNANQVYILDAQNQGNTGPGSPNALALFKWDFGGNSPVQVPIGSGGRFGGGNFKVVYESLGDMSLTPALAVDDNLPDFGGLHDASAGAVYVAWATNDVPPQNPANFNFNRILMVGSSDGGNTFSAPVILNNNGNSLSASGAAGHQADTAPRLAISQGRLPNPTIYGVADQGVPAGQVSVVYDDFHTGAGASPPQDYIWSNRTPGIVSLTTPYTGVNKGIAPGPQGGGSTPTSFPINVTAQDVAKFSDPNVFLDSLSVSLILSHSSISDLQLVLTSPTGRTIILSNSGGQPGGANFGIATDGEESPTVFTDSASSTASISSQTATSPYMGNYRPAGGGPPTNARTLNALVSGLRPADLIGTWTLTVNNTNTTAGNLVSLSLNFVSGLTAGLNRLVATTYVRGALTTPYPTATSITAQGIGPAPAIASDNTLGTQSEFQGRLYVVYTNHLNLTNNPADNTDIQMMVSDDGGLTWGLPAAPGSVVPGSLYGNQVNDDLAINDGFSQSNGQNAGRPQMQPQVAVDQATGTVVISWLDARNDAARARVATYVSASNDGGMTYSPQVFANTAQTATDALTGKTVNLGPIPENQSGGNASTEGIFGFGTRQGLAVYGGKVYPIWASNENGGSNGKEALGVRTSTILVPAGPRIVSSTMGPVGLPGDTLNPTTPNGPQAKAIIVRFDRPIDPTSFVPGDVEIFFKSPTGLTASTTALTVTPIKPGDAHYVDDPSNPNAFYGYNQYLVTFDPDFATKANSNIKSNVGTYSYIVFPGQIHDLIPTVNQAALVPVAGSTRTFTDSTPTPIPPVLASGPQTITPSVNVTGYAAGQVVQNVTVNVSIDWSLDQTLTLALIAPDGTRILLSSQRGGQGQDYTNTTFDDSAGTSIAAAAPPFTGSFAPEVPLAELLGNQAINGTWTLQIINNIPGGIGAGLINWSLTLTAGVVTPATVAGNAMAQNVNLVPGTPAGGGRLGDAYAVPTPLGTNFTAGQFPSFPYDQDTLPLMVVGPHIVSTHVPGAAASADNLVTNNTVSKIDVTFDRPMQVSTISAANILRIMGPIGAISGPFTLTPLNPVNGLATSFEIGFPTQQLNGTYTITLGPVPGKAILSAAGDAIDTNLNAGIDVLKGTPATSAAPLPAVNYTSADVPLAIAPQTTVDSTLNVPLSFQVTTGMTVTLSIDYPFDPDLEAFLISPTGKKIRLFLQGTGTTGTQARFSTTTFDDAAATLIANGGPPFFGSYKPQDPLSNLNGDDAQGTWTLEIVNHAPASSTNAGSLVSWSLNFPQFTTSTGLGEPVADQATASFRIFTADPTNPLSHNTWTPIGPAPSTNSTQGRGYSGQVATIAVDPSDPSGNTVYVASSSGGIWKTTDFLTTKAIGPTYIPLTDFGPTYGMNIGSITIFPRNNDPNQSIIIAGTGFADSSNYATFGNSSRGVGFLRSMDGGATWTLLDSTDNNLPVAQRDHLFTATDAQGNGTSTFKVIVDPRLGVNGQVIVYAAMSGLHGGLWRSLDTGQTWQKLSTDAVQGTSATDIVLDLNSAVINAVSNPTGNVNTIYVAFQGAGGGVYVSPNRGQTLNLMAGNDFDPLIRDPKWVPPPAIIVANGTFPANPGRIVLAHPSLLPATSQLNDALNTIYEGWLYAAVASPDGNGLMGLYMTKDNGATWTQIHLGNVASGGFIQGELPTNDPSTGATYDPTTSNALPNSSNYNIALTIDPTNPNVVYLGGTAVDNPTGLIRIDTTKIFDSHAAVAYDSSRPDGGQTYFNSAGRVQLKNVNNGAPVPYLNLIVDPGSLFNSNATLFLSNVNSVGSSDDGGGPGFTNDGSGVTWIPFDQLLQGSTGLHRMITIVDPMTGHARLIVADDQGIFTGVDDNGTLSAGIGTAVSPNQSRNGNLDTAQFLYSAAQPSSLAAQAALALAYANGMHTGIGASDPGVLSNGNDNWEMLTDGNFGGEISGVGVQTDQQGRGIVYQYLYPGQGGAFTDFFQVSTNGGAFISRTTGLIQTNGVSDPQWPTGSAYYGNDLMQGNFTVNPLNGDQVIISSNAGRVFSTIDQGEDWLVIANPTDLDGTYAPALTYGAPDPKGLGGIGNLNNFLYAGTVGGHIFVTTTGGGSTGNGNAWTDISSGLDGSPVRKIVADPTRGNHDAFAVTEKGVYYTPNSLATGTANIWTNITGNLFSTMNSPFGSSAQATALTTYLTSLAVDWRYVIPITPTPTNGGPVTHPVLYVSGNAGVYRSLDQGQTWALYPNIAFDAAPADGGELPNVSVTDLSLSLGNIDPTNGRPVAAPGDANSLIASTFGRGSFSIRLAPIVFPNTAQTPNNIFLDPSQLAGTSTDGLPLLTPLSSQPIINGFSEQTAFGNVVTINLYDLTGGGKVLIGTGTTDPSGNFTIQVNQGAFTANGTKTLGIQATDQSGTQGNMAQFQFVLQANNLGQPVPPTPPTIRLDPTTDSSHGQSITKDTTPQVLGTTDPKTDLALSYSTDGGATWTVVAFGSQPVSDASGNISLAFPTALADGTYQVKVTASNQYGTADSNIVNVTIDTQGPTQKPTLGILNSDDTGIKGDGITSARQPHFIGVADKGAIVDLFNVNNLSVPLAEVSADPNTGAFSIQLPNNLFDGSITVQVSARDVAGNQGPSSEAFTLRVATTAGDFNGDGMADPAVFQRIGPQAANWLVQGVTLPAGTPYGSNTLDIPILGDFNGVGVDQFAVYRPSTGTWFVDGVYPPSGINFGAPNLDIPVPADYNGDGTTEIAIYRPTTGQWYISGMTATTIPVLGQAGDIPVPGDYAGNGSAQIAVYRPSTGQFFIAGPGNVTTGITPIKVGTPHEIPVPGFYDNSVSSHKLEPAVFNPTTGVMTIVGPGGAIRALQFTPNTIPVSADYTGSGSDEAATLDPTTGKITFYAPGTTTSPQTINFLPGSAGMDPVVAPLAYRMLPVIGDYNGATTTDPALFSRATNPIRWTIPGATPSPTTLYGANTLDIPVQGDFLGTGKTQVAIYRPSSGQWFILGAAKNPTAFGGMNNIDIPAPADYNGDGKTDLAVFRASTGTWYIKQPVGPALTIKLGAGGDTPVPGNYDGTGKDEAAVFEPANGFHPSRWIINSPNGPRTIAYGGPNDIPVPGDYNGGGRTQLAVYRPGPASAWYILGNSQPIMFGGATDIPVPGDYDGVGHDQIAVYQPSTGLLYIRGHNGPDGKALPINLGVKNAIPANAPYLYRELNSPVKAGHVTTTTIHSLNFAAQAATLSATIAPSTPAPVMVAPPPPAPTPQIKTAVARNPTPPTNGARPNQAITTPKHHKIGRAGGTRAAHLHDTALELLHRLRGKRA